MNMPMERYKPEQIVMVLRQIEVQMANGKTAPQACKEAGIHTQTYYRWRKEYGGGKLLSPERRRCAVERAEREYRMSERHACRLLGQWRGTQRYESIQRADEDELTAAGIALASQYGRYGYKKITALLPMAGWTVGRDRVEQIWRREGLKVPRKQRPRRRLWLNDGSCIRLRPERANHVWSYDFVSARTHNGRLLRILTLIDEYTRECLALRGARG